MTFTLETAASIPADPSRAPAELLRPSLPPATRPDLPSRYGAIIYRKSGAGHKHLYIIGASHRCALTGESARNAIQTQVEVYRIGEWLICYDGVRLLLPEGFFQRKNSSGLTAERLLLRAMRSPAAGAADDAYLRQLLGGTGGETGGATGAGTSAEALLRSHYHLHLRQVEDEELHAAVGDLLRLTESLTKTAYVPMLFHASLRRLQQRRSLAMLRNIPDVVEAELRAGHIESRKAIFTIGVSHVDAIIRALETAADAQNPDGLRLLSEEYAVTVILPRALADDHMACKLIRLEGP